MVYNPAKRSLSRVFVLEGRARPDHEPDYLFCGRAGPVSQNFGGVTNIEAPSPDRYGDFDVIGETQAEKERGTSQVVARFPLDVLSDLLRIAKKRCPIDLHYNFGQCTRPTDYNVFTKKLILENARFETYSTDELGAIESGENTAVNEMVDVTYADKYEVVPLVAVSRGSDVVFNPIIDMIKCDEASCGNCDPESDGCQRVYAVASNSPGSPGTAPDVIYSANKGRTWATNEINSMLASEAPTGIACLDTFVVVISSASCSLHYKSKANVQAGTVGGWTEQATGFVATKCPLAIWSVGDFAFVVGQGGYVYTLRDVGAGVVVVDAGIATANNLNAVHALDDKFAVAVGASDTVVFTKDQLTWAAVSATGGGNDLTTVWCLSKTVWIVGDNAGNVYYTLDGGQNWTQSALPVTLARVNRIKFSTASVGYLAGEITGTAGRILRTYDAGQSWVVMPEQAGVSIPASDSYDALAVCYEDPNWMAAGGLADDALDGIIIVASAVAP